MSDVRIFLDTLGERNKTIITMRYGVFEHTRKHTLDEISVKLGITKERVRQIQLNLLSQLKVYLTDRWEHHCIIKN